jgi:hypothetical protein
VDVDELVVVGVKVDEVELPSPVGEVEVVDDAGVDVAAVDEVDELVVLMSEVSEPS